MMLLASLSLGDQFISLGKAFLSALAVAEAEDLKAISSGLLPHRIMFSEAPDAFLPRWQTPQTSQFEPCSQQNHAEEQQHRVAVTTESPHHTSPLTKEPPEQTIFTALTTLEDPEPERSSGDEEMQELSET